MFVQGLQYPYYEPVYGLRYKMIMEPQVSATAVASVNMNEDMVRFNLTGTFAEGDQITFAWPGFTQADCDPTYFLGQVYVYNYSHWPSVWFGYQTGIHGVQNISMDVIQLCYKSAAGDAPNSWSRAQKTINAPYFIKVSEYTVVQNEKCPELISFMPLYGSTELYETDSVIQFNFKTQEVYPSRQSDIGPVYGIIRIFRGAIQQDGTIFKTS